MTKNTASIPMRMCAVTREKLPKAELVRFALVDGRVVVDREGRVRSRGLNMKPDITVFDQAEKIKIFRRTFNVEVDQEKLRKDFESYLEEKFRPKKVVRVSAKELGNLKKS